MTLSRPWLSHLALAAILSACGGVGPEIGEEKEGTLEDAVHEGDAPPALMTQMRACQQGPCEVRIVNEATQRCVALGSDGQWVTEPCSDSAEQTFVISSTQQGFWSFDLRGIRHQASGRCLSYGPNAPRADPCSSSSLAQRWSFVTGGHDEWIEPEATHGADLYPSRSDSLLRDEGTSHRVVSHVRGTTINRSARWTFVATTTSEPEPEPAPTNVLSASGSVTRSQELRWATASLQAGTYTFAMSGTNDADLYVRIGSAPTLSSYTCRPYRSDSNERCVVTLAAPATVHAMVRGYAASSSFTLTGTR